MRSTLHLMSLLVLTIFASQAWPVMAVPANLYQYDAGMKDISVENTELVHQNYAYDNIGNIQHYGVKAITNAQDEKIQIGSFFAFLSDFNVTKKGLGGNPFKGKTPQQIDDAFRKKGFDVKGTDPVAGKGTYINPKTGRKFNIDKGGKYKKGTELPHVDVQRPSSSSLPKKNFL